MLNSLPNHILDHIYLYIWLNKITELNKQYHKIFKLSPSDHYLHTRNIWDHQHNYYFYFNFRKLDNTWYEKRKRILCYSDPRISSYKPKIKYNYITRPKKYGKELFQKKDAWDNLNLMTPRACMEIYLSEVSALGNGYHNIHLHLPN